MVLCAFAVWHFLAVPFKKNIWHFSGTPHSWTCFLMLKRFAEENTKSAEGIGKHGNVTIKAIDGVARGVWSLAFARSFLK